MKKFTILIGLVLIAAMPVAADVVWSEDFSDVSDWSLISNPSNDAKVTSMGGLGHFTEPSPGMGWPNGATFISSGRAAFDPLSKSDYSLGFTVTAISNSMSFDFGLDCFDTNNVYVTTVGNVFPNQAFTGTTNINLGGFAFDPAVALISPKLSIHTGEGGQTVSFDSMSVDQQVIPEPGSLALILGGAAMLLVRRRIARR